MCCTVVVVSQARRRALSSLYSTTLPLCLDSRRRVSVVVVVLVVCRLTQKSTHIYTYTAAAAHIHNRSYGLTVSFSSLLFILAAYRSIRYQPSCPSPLADNTSALFLPFSTWPTSNFGVSFFSDTLQCLFCCESSKNCAVHLSVHPTLQRGQSVKRRGNTRASSKCVPAVSVPPRVRQADHNNSCTNHLANKPQANKLNHNGVR